MPMLERITIHPVKSLDGLQVDSCQVLPGAGLEHDRRWQLIDMDGRVMNAKRAAVLHAIRAEFRIDGLAADAATLPSLAANVVALAVDPAAVAAGAIPDVGRLAGLGPDVFPLLPGSEGPCGWLSEALGRDVLLVERAGGGFPDDREAPGPTLVATATLVEVARWYGFDLEECRRRFRVNLEIDGCEAFWEDTLASPARPEPAGPAAGEMLHAGAPLSPPEPREFTIGDVGLRATNVCRRCAVPGRDSRTGAVTAHFRDVFEAWRGRTLRPDVDAAAWSHRYRLSVNTVALEAGPLVLGQSVALRPTVSVRAG